MSGYWRWVLKRSAWVLLLLGAVSALLLPSLDDLRINTSPSTLILSDSPANLVHQKTRRIFGNDEVLLIGLTADDLLHTDTLASIRQVTWDIEAISGVRRVLSLTNTLDILERDGAVEISPLIPESPEQLDPQALRARLRDNPLYEKELISSDLRTTSLLVFLEERSSQSEDWMSRLVAEIRTAAAPLARQGNLFFGGVPEMEVAGMGNMVRDLWVFTPITVLLVMVILAFDFHSRRGVILPLAAIGLTLVCTLAAMVLGGFPLKPTTLVLPSLLIANGGSYTIHLLTHYYQCLLQAYDRISSDGRGRLTRQQYREVVAESLQRAHRPIATSAFTTMAGFAALIFNRIPAIRDLGLFAVLGVFLSYVFCMHLIPAILVYLRVPSRHRISGHDRSHRHTFFEKLGHFNLDNRRWIYSIAGLCAVLGLAGAFQVKVRTDYLAHFRDSAPVVQATRTFEEHLSGLSGFSIVIESRDRSPLTDPATLRAVDRIQQRLQDVPGVDRTLSIVDSMKLLNQALHQNQPAFFRLPGQQDILVEMLDLIESDPRELSREFLSEDHTALRILVRSSLFESTQLRALTDQVGQLAAPLLPPTTQLQTTGTLVLMNLTSDQLAREQVKSLLLSVTFIFTILIFLCRSFKVGLMCMIPAGLPVLMFFGLLGWGGLSLNVNTSVIAAIAIGIGVDNCIQYLVRFQRCRREGLSPQASARESLTRAGGPMSAAASVVALGFLVFGLSRFAPVSQFGLLSAFVMGFNLVTNLLLLPTLLLVVHGSARARDGSAPISPRESQ
ncbi:MAG: MMPL family transporter [Acidobacteriota bacterium]|nr:MMPL family transporter [Acidobacteriota bacterium]